MSRKWPFPWAQLIAGICCLPVHTQAQWVAFNDYAPGFATHSNATTFGPGQSGPLKNIASGAALGVLVTVTATGGAGGNVAGWPTYGTPASVVFHDFVDFGGKPDPALEMTATNESVTYTFTGLNPGSEYNFQGSAVRGHFNYTDRWSVFEITGAASFTSRHTPGALTTAQVPTLALTEVAINTGDNNRGDVAWWEHIQPGLDGSFAVTSKKYSGPVPGGSSAGSKGYGIAGFRLEQAGSYSGRSHLPPRAAALELPAINGIRTVFMILMENHDWDSIQGSPFCPYINNTLLPQSSYTTAYYSKLGVHPSEPNYLWLVAGTNFNVRNDDAPSLNHQNSTNTLFHQLDRAGLSWKCYAENISGTDVPDVNAGPYAVRHVPFVFFDSVRTNLAYTTNHIRPFTELARDLTNNTVARFNFLVPNVTNDMHDLASGSPSTRQQGDNWLAREMPRILTSTAYTSGGVIFLVWDEGANETDGPVGMIALSPRAKGGGYHNDIFYTHSALLRTVQDIFGLKPYLADAAYANNLGDLFKTIRVTSARWVTNGFRMTFVNLIPGKTNYVQASSDLNGSNWVNIKTNVANATSLAYTNFSASEIWQFYRLVELP
jgi:hypothetical protein